jgi:3-isopropylmalate/(R)-2-methylmalate dehydratase small subunit
MNATPPPAAGAPCTPVQAASTNALVHLHGPAAPLLRADIDTDTIAPLVRGIAGPQPAGRRSAEELAQRLFGPWRYDAAGRENPDFVLNREPFRHAPFLIAGPNFACGSSRETAATMLQAFGIRCVIAPSFGGIFRDNCFRNHMLALALPWPQVQALARQAESGAAFTLDVEHCTLTPPDGTALTFELPAYRHRQLLTGADPIALTLEHAGEIEAWRARSRALRPWETQAQPGPQG